MCGLRSAGLPCQGWDSFNAAKGCSAHVCYPVPCLSVPFFDDPDAIGSLERTPFVGRQAAGLLSGLGVILLTFFGAPDFSNVVERAGEYDITPALVAGDGSDPVSLRDAIVE